MFRRIDVRPGCGLCVQIPEVVALLRPVMAVYVKWDRSLAA